MSVLFGGLAGFAFAAAATGGPSRRIALLGGAAASIQLRLVCNLLDGMAIEGGKKTKSGEVWNDLPDRSADSLILVPAGYAVGAAAWGPALGWAAALLGVLTAYVRVLGGSLGLPQDFGVPMAKQHRMAVKSAAAPLSAGDAAVGAPPRVLVVALATVVVGSAATVVRRTHRIVSALEAR
jgi:phosphatidylglycerophosphate synthase